MPLVMALLRVLHSCERYAETVVEKEELSADAKTERSHWMPCDEDARLLLLASAREPLKMNLMRKTEQAETTDVSS
jgi:hypothetical protein